MIVALPLYSSGRKGMGMGREGCREGWGGGNQDKE